MNLDRQIIDEAMVANNFESLVIKTAVSSIAIHA